MADVTRDQLQARREQYLQLAAEYHRQAVGCEGAAQAIEELINELFPMTVSELGEMLGAQEIGEPQEVEREH
jgi:hypothetical protein